MIHDKLVASLELNLNFPFFYYYAGEVNIVKNYLFMIAFINDFLVQFTLF